MIGRRLGHYEITEKLGEGGMGAVYRARDTTLGRDVALKLLPEFVAADREKIARLEREARLLASLSHPNIATLHGLEESNGLKYLVMELVPGETLAERIAAGPLRIEECLGIFRQIAEGLEAAHEKGIVHRDLKPANVVVTPEGRVKILDFGLAKAIAEEAPSSDLSKSPTLTREGTEHGVILGTASYMSPEQARGKGLDRRTDIWSLGCVFYEALTGRKAFPGETVSDILAAILEREPDWTALPAGMPGKIRELLRWCLQKDPHRRLRDIGDARIEGDEPSASPATVPRYLYLPWAVAALASGIAVWSLTRHGAEQERLVSRLTVTLPREQAINDPDNPGLAVSPDGRSLVYLADSSGQRMLYARPLDQLEARPIAGTEGAGGAFFSPDGEWVGFDTPGKLKKVRLDGGLPVVVCDTRGAEGSTWGTNDAILFSPNSRSGLSFVSAMGGSPSVASTPDPSQGEVGHRWPVILPDGRSALFTIQTHTGSHRVGLLSLETGKHRVLIDGGSFARYVSTGHLAYVSEGVLLAVPFDLEHLAVAGEPSLVVDGVWTDPASGAAHFALSEDGTLAYIPRRSVERSLVWVDRAGVLRPLTEIRRGFTDPRLSPDGQRVAVSIDEDGEIWIHEMTRDALVRLTFSQKDNQAPLWTPDGKRLTFQRGSPRNIFWQPADGSGEAERLITSPNYQRPCSWSPDGKVLVYVERTGSGGIEDLWVLSLERESQKTPLLQSPFRERHGVISPDGRLFAYASDESGTLEIYVRPFPGPGGKWQISNEEGTQPVWAHSGREIFYRNGEKMMAVAVETEPAFRAGKPRVLFEGDFHRPDLSFPQYDVAADDQKFVMIQELESRTQIHIVLNWFEELKARVPSPKR